MTGLALAIDALATFRLTKLVVDDQLTAELRDAIIEGAYVAAGRREQVLAGWDEDPTGTPGAWADEIVPNDPDPPKLAFLFTCPWCAGMYVAAGVAVARRVAPRSWGALAKVLALSASAGLLSSMAE